MASISVVPWQPLLVQKKHILNSHFHTKKTSCSVIRNEKTSSFSYRSIANVPFYELPGASFDQYMDDRLRVLKAVFPEKGNSKQLNEEEWRVEMPSIQCFILKVQPKVDVRLRIKSNGEDYPSHVPHHISKILELHFTRWELQGLNSLYNDPYDFNLDVRGIIYPERKGKSSWLKNQMEMKINFTVSPTMTFVPEHILKDALELVFKTMWNQMKQEFHGNLLADYNSFKRYKSKKSPV
ncbi:hypothetical protein MtrunA17_Chr6g0453601 [Medicago truncatula]|uniref:DUF1997 family protein n=2 Tax=Medicago truncatula TaxID=3880 RepID=G7KKZ0_MEDTR|nr:uncharacterized protein LOC11414476 [Medicago truncatula]AES74761.1 DUF1997 family protein [Medicago truncatula]RHN50085.1 hypothetical protein MtrunA17_Chr6g0453601 [Medicago truncatula]